MSGHRYKTVFGIHATLELAAGRLGISVKEAESRIIRGSDDIQIIKI